MNCIPGSFHQEKILVDFATCSHAWNFFLQFFWSVTKNIILWQALLHWWKFIPPNTSIVHRYSRVWRNFLSSEIFLLYGIAKLMYGFCYTIKVHLLSKPLHWESKILQLSHFPFQEKLKIQIHTLHLIMWYVSTQNVNCETLKQILTILLYLCIPVL
jgi:hypothetical protein